MNARIIVNLNANSEFCFAGESSIISEWTTTLNFKP